MPAAGGALALPYHSIVLHWRLALRHRAVMNKGPSPTASSARNKRNPGNEREGGDEQACSNPFEE